MELTISFQELFRSHHQQTAGVDGLPDSGAESVSGRRSAATQRLRPSLSLPPRPGPPSLPPSPSPSPPASLSLSLTLSLYLSLFLFLSLSLSLSLSVRGPRRLRSRRQASLRRMTEDEARGEPCKSRRPCRGCGLKPRLTRSLTRIA